MDPNFFLDNTARLLVPHNCDRSVFRKLLPNSMYTIYHAVLARSDAPAYLLQWRFVRKIYLVCFSRIRLAIKRVF